MGWHKLSAISNSVLLIAVALLEIADDLMTYIAASMLQVLYFSGTKETSNGVKM